MKKSIIRLSIYVVIAIAISAVLLTSCSAGRGMTNCDAIKYKMSGYNFR